MASDYQQILEYWFGGDFRLNFQQKWFPTEQVQRQTDKHIIENFSSLLKQAEVGELDNWKQNPRSTVALIIVLDQFSRHIYRHSESKEQLKQNDAKALSLAEEVLQKCWQEQLSTPEMIFSLMPLRHSSTVERLKTVMDVIGVRSKELKDSSELLERFQKATYRRLQDLEVIEKWYPGKEILEHFEFEADESDMQSNKLYQSVMKFLQTKKYKQFKIMTVSLSGGVDSMVLTAILKKIKETQGNTFEIHAIHVDYGNRPESNDEALFVEDWCSRKGVHFRKITMDGITRGNTKRDEYEKLTRELRFSAYTKFLEECKGECPAIMFGHHIGDVQENIISNMMKGCSLLDLSGMYPESTVNSVIIWRPMMKHPKTDILEFAHKYGIPYFLDTTPKWSTRGKMRNKLMPLLKDMYGEGFLQHLTNLALDSEQLNNIMYKQLLNPFWNSVVQTKVCVYFDFTAYMDQPTLFWKEALTHVCHSMLGCGLIGERSIKELLLKRFARIRNPIRGKLPDDCFLALKKENRAYVKDNTLIIFRKNIFLRSSNSKYYTYYEKGTQIEINREYHFGPWTVITRIVSFDDYEDQFYQKMDFYAALSGDLTYYLYRTESYQLYPEDKRIPIRGMDPHIKSAFPLVTYNDGITVGGKKKCPTPIDKDTLLEVRVFISDVNTSNRGGDATSDSTINNNNNNSNDSNITASK